MSYSILIVDDELLMRIELNELVKNIPGYHICGETGNGREALAFMNANHPDIVLLDLSMPVMDGIEVLKAVKDIPGNPRFLVLSCHDEFNLVREALTNGAQDYLLKNSLDQAVLKDALDQLAAQIQADSHWNGTETPALDPNQKILYKQNFLRCFLSGAGTAENFADYFAVDQKNCCCILFSIKRYDQVAARYPDQNMDFMTNSLLNIFKNSLEKEQSGEFSELESNLFVFLTDFSHLQSAHKIRLTQNAILQKFLFLAKQYLNVELVIGVGSVYTDHTDLINSCRQAKMALLSSFYNKRSIIFYENAKTADVSDNNFDKMEQRAICYCIRKEYQKLKEYLDVIFQTVSQADTCHYPDPDKFRSLYTNMCRLIAANEHLNISVDNYNNFEAFEELHQKFVEDFYDTIGLNALSDADHITKDVIRYIQLHYKEDLRVTQIAESLQISENYLSRTFNNCVGVSIPNYINTFRIGKAQDYLKNTNMKIYEIAHTLGYNSVSYFNTAFRKVTGVTPAQYRNRHR